MDTIVWIVLVLAIVAVLAAGAFMLWQSQNRRSRKLRSEFGNEYDRAVEEFGSKGRAERELAARQQRIQRLHIKALSHEDTERYAAEWKQVQAHFVDDPKASLKEADDLVGVVMEKRGYPVTDFEQRASDVSVEHPTVVTNYRAAHEISIASDNGKASTEEMRRAMQYYRSLFDDLLVTAEARR